MRVHSFFFFFSSYFSSTTPPKLEALAHVSSLMETSYQQPRASSLTTTNNRQPHNRRPLSCHFILYLSLSYLLFIQLFIYYYIIPFLPFSFYFPLCIAIGVPLPSLSLPMATDLPLLLHLYPQFWEIGKFLFCFIYIYFYFMLCYLISIIFIYGFELEFRLIGLVFDVFVPFGFCYSGCCFVLAFIYY